MVGYAFMGAAHSQAWRTAGRFFDLPLQPDLAVLCGRDADEGGRGGGEAGVAVGRDRLAGSCSPATTSGWSTSARPATPTPRSRSPRWTRASTCCARSRWPTPSTRRAPWSPPPSALRPGGCAAWSASTTGGCPRWRWPGGWCEQGRIGEIRHVRAQYLQDWIVDPEFPLVWRLQTERGRVRGAGRHRRAHRRHGAVRHRRPAHRGLGADRDVRAGAAAAAVGVERARGVGRGASNRTGRGTVDVDDAALFLGRFAGGAVASFEATRFATGRKNALRIELNGSARIARVRPSG